jgi:hypothetical protein
MKIFAIMPFSKTTERHDKGYWDYFYGKVCDIIHKKHYDTIKQLFDVPDFQITRASAPQGNVTKSIVKDLKESDIVIAVLTDHNPNVFYELGVRHTQSNKTIMLCEESQKIPFDLSNYGVGLYKDNRFRYRRVETELLERLEQIASDPDSPDNPFYDFTVKHSQAVKTTSPNIKVSIVDQIEGQNRPRPPTFYREAERMSGGEVRYKERTFLGFAIELMNYTTETISIIDTALECVISSERFSTNKMYHDTFVETAAASVSIGQSYRRKFTLEPRKIYQDMAVFVLDRSVPQEVSEITARLHVVDMFGNSYSSPEVKFAPYC